MPQEVGYISDIIDKHGVVHVTNMEVGHIINQVWWQKVVKEATEEEIP